MVDECDCVWYWCWGCIVVVVVECCVEYEIVVCIGEVVGILVFCLEVVGFVVEVEYCVGC